MLNDLCSGSERAGNDDYDIAIDNDSGIGGKFDAVTYNCTDTDDHSHTQLHANHKSDSDNAIRNVAKYEHKRKLQTEVKSGRETNTL